MSDNKPSFSVVRYRSEDAAHAGILVESNDAHPRILLLQETGLYVRTLDKAELRYVANMPSQSLAVATESMRRVAANLGATEAANEILTLLDDQAA